MKSKSFLQLVILSLFICLTSFDVRADYQSVLSAEAVVWANEIGQNLIETLSDKDVEKKYAKLDVLIEENIDIDYIAKFVMGSNWRKMTKEQRERYIPLFHKYAKSLYRSFNVDFDKNNINFSVNTTVEENYYTLVYANIKVNSKETGNLDVTVEFRIHKNNGRIMVTDLKIADVSFAIIFRNRFAENIKNNDGEIEWFLEDLEDLANSSEINEVKNILEN